jgi:hypothetical protein
VARAHTEASLFRGILACPFSSSEGGSTTTTNDAGRIPIIERLASYIVYDPQQHQHKQVSSSLSSSPPPPAKATLALHLAVLRLLSMLTVKNDDAVALLAESVGLLSRLIVRIAVDAGALYESDGDGFGGPFLSVGMCVSMITNDFFFYIDFFWLF